MTKRHKRVCGNDTVRPVYNMLLHVLALPIRKLYPSVHKTIRAIGQGVLKLNQAGVDPIQEANKGSRVIAVTPFVVVAATRVVCSA